MVISKGLIMWLRAAFFIILGLVFSVSTVLAEVKLPTADYTLGVTDNECLDSLTDGMGLKLGTKAVLSGGHMPVRISKPDPAQVNY